MSDAHFSAFVCILGFCNLPLRSLIRVFGVHVFAFFCILVILQSAPAGLGGDAFIGRVAWEIRGFGTVTARFGRVAGSLISQRRRYQALEGTK